MRKTARRRGALQTRRLTRGPARLQIARQRATLARKVRDIDHLLQGEAQAALELDPQRIGDRISDQVRISYRAGPRGGCRPRAFASRG
jgi:hypothetical protein